MNKLIDEIRRDFKREFLSEVFKEDVKVVDIRDYIEYVEEKGSWEVDYEVKYFREWIENNK